jgi:hypothetical protein
MKFHSVCRIVFLCDFLMRFQFFFAVVRFSNEISCFPAASLSYAISVCCEISLWHFMLFGPYEIS